MKKNSIKKRILFSSVTLGLSTAAICGISSLGFNSLTVNNSVKVNSNLENATIANTNKENASANMIPWNKSSSDGVDFSAPRQNIAFNGDNTSYAIINSSSSSSSSSSFDNITRYDMTNGNMVWSKKASDTNKNGQNNNANTNGSKFIATSFLQKSGSRTNDILLALVLYSDNKVHLVSFNWNDGSILYNVNVTDSPVTDLSTNGFNNQGYINVVNSSENLQINIMGTFIKDKENSHFNYVKVTKLDDTTLEGHKKISIPQDVFNNYFSSESASKSKVSNIYNDNNYTYFVLQKELTNYSKIAESNLVSIMRIPNNIDNYTISGSDFLSFGISTDEAKVFTTSNKALVVSAVQSESKTYFLISQDQSNGNGKEADPQVQKGYVVASFDNNSFSNVSKKTITVPTNDKFGFVLSLFPLYSNTNEINGFVGLTSKNTAVYFNKEFNTSSMYYDFSTLNATDSNKNIYNIFTRENDANWYGIMQDGVIIQFSGSTLLGELRKLNGQNRDEIPVKYNLINPQDVPSHLTFQTMDSLKSQLQQDASEFINVKSYDPVFGFPKITGEVTNETEISGTGNKKVTISFKQEIRQYVPSTGAINGSTNYIKLGSQTYTITNDVSSYVIKPKAEAAQFITNKYPSKVTTDDIEQILELSNFGNYTLTLIPNDAQGLLTVRVRSDSVWVNINGVKTLMNNYNQDIVIGTVNDPYFQIDLLNGLSSSLDLVTQEYYEANKDSLLILSSKYASTLPSAATKENILNDFIKFGDAFNNAQLISKGLIQKPTVNNITLVPIDSEGYVFVTVTVPRILNERNVVYSFKTAQVFNRNALSNKNVYLTFKSDEEVAAQTIDNGSMLTSLYPSKVKEGFSTSTTTYMDYFVSMSYYVSSLIFNTNNDSPNKASYSVDVNDSLGYLTITITFPQNIEGLGGKVFTRTFTGFATTTSTASTNYPTFNFNNGFDPKTISGFQNKKPSDVTLTDVETKFSELFNYGSGNTSSASLKKEISITPVDSSGALIVTVTFYNWVEKGSEGGPGSIIIPKKEFTTIVSGFQIKANFTDTIVWKSFDELDGIYKNSTVENAYNTLNSQTTDLEKLQQVANISDSLLTKISNIEQSQLSVITQLDASLNSLQIVANFQIDGVQHSYATQYSGFIMSASQYNVGLVAADSEEIEELKQYLPSEITDEQINSLITTTTNNLNKKVEKVIDDVSGTLTVSVQLINQNNSTEGMPMASQTYVGFKTNVPEYKGTNILIVSLSIVIPFILLLCPILYVVLFVNRRDIKKFNKVLDARLTEHMNRKKTTEVNKIEDLLSIDND